ncbi:hypothetical protein [Desertibacillus haloalkaliphilus]|uniref:hypothetical protein n=1 Tax=Desertibacillus haloalkaliphilus TaxID=1328930 RepID=UPI001C270C3C|nr:hypothetical protein [Desertibacillus haloalkaliphilus]
MLRSKKMANKVPYLLLGVIHLFILVYTFYKSKDKKRHIILLLNYIGFAYIFDYIVVSLYSGYQYRPKFLKQKQLDDILGSVLSQFFYVPVTALFITSFHLGWKVKLLFTVCFSMIERLFIYLGIFKNNWWKTMYTFVLIFISFIINDIWYRQLKKENLFVTTISFFNMIQVTWMNIVFTFAVLRQLRYGSDWFFSWKEHFRVAPAIGLLISLLLAWGTRIGSWRAKLKLLCSMLVIDMFLMKEQLLKVKSFPILLTIYLLMIYSASYFKRLVFIEANKCRS